MRIFVYKTLFIFLCTIIAYKLTIGNLIQTVETKIEAIYSKKNINDVKEKIREEIKSAVQDDRMLDKEDAILLKKFINKLKIEIESAN